MSSVNRFKYFLKMASYNVPQDDMYAAGSMQRHVDSQIDSAASKKNIGTLVGGTLGATAAYKISKPFADKRIPLSQQKIRGAAMLGAGLFAAKKARDYLSPPSKSSGAV
jgi:hypothetical protein